MLIKFNLDNICRHTCLQFNLSRTAGRFIGQRRKGQGRIISFRNANEEVTLMQM